MRVAEAVGTALARCGARQVFGAHGGAGLPVAVALVDGGARFVGARHEGGAATMADAWARITGEVAVLVVHRGSGLTDAVAGIAEAAACRTPLVVLTDGSGGRTAGPGIDQEALALAVGVAGLRISSAAGCVDEAVAGYQHARNERRTVLLDLPSDVREATDEAADRATLLLPTPPPPVPMVSPDQLDALVDLLAHARRPVLVAGRGARGARAEVVALADACDALLLTSSAAHGLFAGEPWSLGLCGHLATPLAAELVAQADVVVALGCSPPPGTTLALDADVRVAQIDLDPAAIGRGRPVDVGVVGDVASVARTAAQLLALRADLAPLWSQGRRDEALAARVAAEGRWRDVGYQDCSDADGIDPRTLTRLLDDVLPDERTVAVDPGEFAGYPSAYLAVPDAGGFVGPGSPRATGPGLAAAIGAAVARPERLAVAALDDDGALGAAAELDTVRRLGLSLMVLVYGADGGTTGAADLAAIGAGHGFETVTVAGPSDVEEVRRWVEGDRARPLLVYARVVSQPGPWLPQGGGLV